MGDGDGPRRGPGSASTSPAGPADLDGAAQAGTGLRRGPAAHGAGPGRGEIAVDGPSRSWPPGPALTAGFAAGLAVESHRPAHSRPGSSGMDSLRRLPRLPRRQPPCPPSPPDRKNTTPKDLTGGARPRPRAEQITAHPGLVHAPARVEQGGEERPSAKLGDGRLRPARRWWPPSWASCRCACWCAPGCATWRCTPITAAPASTGPVRPGPGAGAGRRHRERDRGRPGLPGSAWTRPTGSWRASRVHSL